MTTIRHTERTYYAPLMKILEEDLGAPGAQEESIIAGSNPDILFDYFGKEWILSVKMGDPTATITQGAWTQFVRHKGESRRDLEQQEGQEEAE